jgi:hypothetical protein
MSAFSAAFAIVAVEININAEATIDFMSLTPCVVVSGLQPVSGSVFIKVYVNNKPKFGSKFFRQLFQPSCRGKGSPPSACSNEGPQCRRDRKEDSVFCSFIGRALTVEYSGHGRTGCGGPPWAATTTRQKNVPAQLLS